jgi:hypothetical protein
MNGERVDIRERQMERQREMGVGRECKKIYSKNCLINTNDKVISLLCLSLHLLPTNKILITIRVQQQVVMSGSDGFDNRQMLSGCVTISYVVGVANK